MPYMEFTDPAGHTIRIDVTDGVYTRTVDGTVVDTHPATPEEKSNFGAALPPVTLPPGIAAAEQGIKQMSAQSAAFAQQIAADVQAVQAGWATLPAGQQQAIVLRILNGFGTVMSVVKDHATLTGVLPPT